MPSTIAHAYIGLDVLKKIDEKPKKIINNHSNNYKIYCQNMDVLYFYHIFLVKENNIQTLGHRFHNRNVFDYFQDMVNDNRDNKDEELFTFISGLITHYQADRIMHPYINYYSYNKNKIKLIDKHFEIETYLDNYFVKKNVSDDYQKINNYSFVFDKYTECKIIENEIDKIFKKYFKFDKMGKYYYKSIKEMQFFYKYMRHDSLGIKRKIYSILDYNPFNIRRLKYLSYHFDLDKHTDYLNSNHDTWWNIKNKDIVSNKSFQDLYEETLDNSVYIINQLYQYIFENKDIDLKKLIGNYSYASGLSLD